MKMLTLYQTIKVSAVTSASYVYEKGGDIGEVDFL